MNMDDDRQNTEKAAEAQAAPEYLDVKASVEFLRSLGLSNASASFVRGAINSGAVPRLPCGKKFYVSKAAWLRYLEMHSRRRQ
jgi:hypothetical protein